jgi:uncharacterized protein involved in exopolysaccharide biosynthesis
LSIWQTVRRRKFRILLCAAFFIGLAVLYHQIAGPWNESSAQLLVLKKRLDTAPISGPSLVERPVDDYLPTHMLIITSPRIVRDAVVKKDLLAREGLTRESEVRKAVKAATEKLFGERPAADPQDTLTKAIVDSLKVSSDVAKPGASASHEVLNISFRVKDVKDGDAVLDAIIASYQEFLKEAYRSVNTETLGLITRTRDAALKDLEAREAAYRKFRSETPLLWRGKDGSGTTVHQERLFYIDSKRSALRMRRSEIEGSLTAIDEALKQGRSYADLLDLVAGPPTNREIINTGQVGPATQAPDASSAGRGVRETLEEQLVNLELEEGKLKQQGFGEAHPNVQSVHARMDTVRGLLGTSSTKDGRSSDNGGWIAEFVKLKVKLLKQELADNRRTDKSWEALLGRDADSSQVDHPLLKPSMASTDLPVLPIEEKPTIGSLLNSVWCLARPRSDARCL